MGAEETAKYFPTSHDALYLVNELRKGIKIEGRRGVIQYTLDYLTHFQKESDEEIYKSIKKIL